MLLISVCPARDQAHPGIFFCILHKSNSSCSELDHCFAGVRHLRAVSQQPETGHIRTCVYGKVCRRLLRLLVQCGHNTDHFLLSLRRCHLRFYRRVDDSAAKLFCKDQHIALPASEIFIHTIRVHKPGHGQSVFRHIVLDRVTAYKDSSCFSYFVSTAS